MYELHVNRLEMSAQATRTSERLVAVFTFDSCFHNSKRKTSDNLLVECIRLF
jgi:hypothetical protein